jgi:hypothetical protein
MFDKMMEKALERLERSIWLVEHELVPEWKKMLEVDTGKAKAIRYSEYRETIEDEYNKFRTVIDFCRQGQKAMCGHDSVPDELISGREQYENFIAQIDFAETFFEKKIA